MDIYGTLIYVVINQFMLHTPKKRHYTTLNLGVGVGDKFETHIYNGWTSTHLLFLPVSTL